MTKPVFTIIAPIFNELENLPLLYARVREELDKTEQDWELIMVDAGSQDGSTEVIRKLAASDERVRPVIFARNFGHQIAVSAGLDYSRGDAVIIIDSDLQDPPEVIGELIAKWREGYEVVYAVRTEREGETKFKTQTAALFYRMIDRITDVKIPLDTGDFRLMDRKVVDALCALPESNRFMKGLYAWVGFRSLAIPVELEPRGGGSSKFNFARLLHLGMTGLTAFTDWPLRMWTGIGMVLASFSILYGLFLAGRTIIFGHDVAGWSTLAVALFFFSGVQLMSIGVLGEYLARVFNEVKGRPGYLIAEDLSIAAQAE